MTDYDTDSSQIEQLKLKIESLENENRLLLQRIEEETLGSEIRDALRFIDTSAIMKSLMDQKSFLQLLLSMTKKVVKSEAASILLLDPDTEELFFLEAVGEKADEVKKFRLKTWEGIAGYCFTTGEALAVADVTKDSRFKKEISETLQHRQKALMAAPLIYRQEIIGVMEAVNKFDGEVFSSDDLETLVKIANFSAFYLRRSRLYFDLYSLFMIILKNLVARKKISDIPIKEFIELSHKLEKEKVLSSEYSEAVELAALVGVISSKGQEETVLVSTLLKNLNLYFNEKYDYNSQNGMDWMMY